MREFLKVGRRRFTTAWFWPLVLLALPNCTLDRSGLGTPPHLLRGDFPHSSAIMCDIEQYQGPTRRCATPDDLLNGIPLAMAAEALVAGQSNPVGLDFSAAAEVACGAGHPQAILFQGTFPDGSLVCLNCAGAIPVPNADATAVCVNRCRDIVENSTGVPVPPDVVAFCTANSHPSTNFPASGCFDNACSDGGTLRDGFADPRRIPEPVVWTDFHGTSAVGSNLRRDAVTTGTGTADLNTGAVSTQWIAAKDAYVEFEASENDKSHVAGLSEISGGCPFPCTDDEPHIVDINFAISLNSDGRFYVLEGGVLVTGPDVNGSFGTYIAGDRFRVKVKSKIDGTAQVSYVKLAGTCVPGSPCIEVPFPDPVPAHVTPPAAYPLRVDTSFREQFATLANVNIVRIK